MTRSSYLQSSLSVTRSRVTYYRVYWVPWNPKPHFLPSCLQPIVLLYISPTRYVYQHTRHNVCHPPTQNICKCLLNVHRKAIRDMTPLIDPEDDYLTIVAAEEQMSVTEEERKKEIDQLQSKARSEYPTFYCFSHPQTLPPRALPSSRAHPRSRSRLVNAPANSTIGRTTRCTYV